MVGGHWENVSGSIRGTGYHRSRGKGYTAGRCRPCRLVYEWKAGREARLWMARCAKCGHWLEQTTLRNLKRKTAALAETGPIFDAGAGARR